MIEAPSTKHCCDEMDEMLGDPSVPIGYNKIFREYGLIRIDGKTRQLITFCPWCARKLPSSMRSKWFDILEQLNLDPEDPAVPLKMKSDAWWKELPA